MIYRNKLTKKGFSSINHSNIKSSAKIEEKRKNIIEKFLVKFDKTHHKSYEIGKLVRILNFYFESPEVVENFNMEKDFLPYEKKVCERLNIKIASDHHIERELITNTQSPQLNNSSDFTKLSSNNSNDPNTLKTLLTSNNSQREHSEFLPFKRKIEKIKSKEDDEWAKIALAKSLELNEELKIKREKDEERRRKIREDLAQQILFKNERVYSEKETDGIFMKMQSQKNEIIDKIMHEKKESNRKDLIKALEISENLFKLKKEKELEESHKTIEEDKILLEKLKIEDEKERNKRLIKKLNEKNILHENLIENEMMKKRRKELKEEDREKDKIFRNYNYFVNDQNCRLKNLNKENFAESPEKNYLTRGNSNIKSKIQEFQSSEEVQRYQKDFEEKNEKLRKLEIEKKLRKEREIKEINEVLAKQVMERRIRKEEGENTNKQYFDIIMKDIEKYKQENEIESKAVRDKYMKYKTELKNQIDDRFNYKEKTITDDEIKLNKHLLSKVNNSSKANT